MYIGIQLGADLEVRPIGENVSYKSSSIVYLPLRSVVTIAALNECSIPQKLRASLPRLSYIRSSRIPIDVPAVSFRFRIMSSSLV